jgi:flagellar biosynthetic protein FlhB
VAEKDDSQEKTEEPTERRLERAFEEGSLMLPQDTYALGGMVALIATFPLWWVAFSGMTARARDVAAAIANRSVDSPALAAALLREILVPFAAILATFLIVAIAIGLAQQRFRIQFRPLRASLENLSPARGFGRIFGGKALTQTTFNAAKLAIAGLVLSAALQSMLVRYRALGVGGSAREAGQIALDAVLLLAPLAFLMLAAFALTDLLVKRLSNHAQLRMSRQELKEELKESEGRPELKSKLAELRRKRRTTSRKHPLKSADVMIVNPTHYAVALLYEPGRMSAPIVIAKGAGLVARRLRWLAWRESVPIMRVPPVARRLYSQVAVDEPIPDDSFAEVAQILVQVYKLRRRDGAPR